MRQSKWAQALRRSGAAGGTAARQQAGQDTGHPASAVELLAIENGGELLLGAAGGTAWIDNVSDGGCLLLRPEQARRLGTWLVTWATVREQDGRVVQLPR